MSLTFDKHTRMKPSQNHGYRTGVSAVGILSSVPCLTCLEESHKDKRDHSKLRMILQSVMVKNSVIIKCVAVLCLLEDIVGEIIGQGATNRLWNEGYTNRIRSSQTHI